MTQVVIVDNTASDKFGQKCMMGSSQGFDQLTHTFSADRKLDALMEAPCSEAFIEVCIWTGWLQKYLHWMRLSPTSGY